MFIEVDTPGVTHIKVIVGRTLMSHGDQGVY